MAIYIAKNVYFDTIKGIKINRLLPVDLILKYGSIYREY